MRLPQALPVLLLCLAACQAACQQKGDPAGQTSRGFYSPDFDTVWDVAAREMQQAGFVLDHDSSSKATRTLVSRWELAMSPFSARGHRDRATVTIHEVPGARDRWTVEANVTRETNMSLVAPSNPIVAKWENPVRVADRESLLARSIERFFVPRDVSPEFRARYGMPAGPKTSTPGPASTPAPAADPSFPWK